METNFSRDSTTWSWLSDFENTTQLYNVSSTETPDCPRSHILFELGLYGIAMGLLCIFGLVGNTLSFLVFHEDKSTPVASFLLKTLAVADNIFLILCFITFPIKSLLKFFEYNSTVPGYAVYVYLRVWSHPIMYMTQAQTIWQTVVIAMNRFMAVCMPYRAPHLCNIVNIHKMVFLVTAFSILYNVPRFFERQIVMTANATMPLVITTNMGDSDIYNSLYRDALYYIFSFILPLVILIFVNTRVIVSYKASQKRRLRMTSSVRRNTENDNNITLVMIMIVVIFIVCQAPARLVQIIWNYDHSCQPYRFYIIDISNTLEVLNSSVNFLIYCVFHNRFRGTLKRQFCSCGSGNSVKNVSRGLSNPSFKQQSSVQETEGTCLKPVNGNCRNNDITVHEDNVAVDSEKNECQKLMADESKTESCEINLEQTSGHQEDTSGNQLLNDANSNCVVPDNAGDSLHDNDNQV